MYKLYSNHINFSEPSQSTKNTQSWLLKNRISQDETMEYLLNHWSSSCSIKKIKQNKNKKIEPIMICKTKSICLYWIVVYFHWTSNILIQNSLQIQPSISLVTFENHIFLSWMLFQFDEENIFLIKPPESVNQNQYTCTEWSFIFIELQFNSLEINPTKYLFSLTNVYSWVECYFN